MPILEGETPDDWRQVTFSEYDYSGQPARDELGLGLTKCKIVMACDQRWKLLYFEGFRPMLFDLEADPNELSDLGEDPRFEAERSRLTEAIFAWSRRERQRVTVSDQDVREMNDAANVDQGALIGFWDEDQLAEFNERR